MHKPSDNRRIDPALISFLAVSDVQAYLDGLNGTQIVNVTFMKKDGDVTTRAGMNNCHSRRVGGERGAIATQALKDAGNVWLDYPNAAQRTDGRKGFSFNLGRVLAIGELGEHV